MSCPLCGSDLYSSLHYVSEVKSIRKLDGKVVADVCMERTLKCPSLSCKYYRNEQVVETRQVTVYPSYIQIEPVTSISRNVTVREEPVKPPVVKPVEKVTEDISHLMVGKTVCDIFNRGVG